MAISRQKRTPSDLATIDQICDAFEAAWSASGECESLAQWAAKAPPPLRSDLFVELLTLDGELRSRRNGNSLTLEMSRVCPFDVAVPVATEMIPRDRSYTSSISSARHALIDCPTFSGLTRHAAESLGSSFTERCFAAGEPVMTQGEPTRGLFIVLAGELEIHKHAGAQSPEVIDRCGPGSVVGEMSLLSGQTCTATVLARSEVQTLMLGVEAFDRLRSELPEIEIALSQLVSDRLGSRELDALCGRSIGGYRLIKCIGRGGMGVVYECHRDDATQQRLAIKMLRHRFVHEPAVIELFQRESRVLQNLRHPNVVEVYDSFVDLRTRFLVLAYCDGTDLRQVLRDQGKLDESTARGIAGQIACGLRHAHENRVIHLDVKPENVLVDRNGRAAIADFGLCQDLDQDPTDLYIKGTPAYMAPEQLRGERADPSSDWYAMGCLIFEIMTGRRLFHARDPVELLEIKQSAVPSPKWPSWDVSPQVRSLISGLLHPVARKRRCDIDTLCAWARDVPELVRTPR